MTAVTTTPPRDDTSRAFRAALPHLAPFLAVLAAALLLPLVGNDYWALIGTRMAIYWVLVSGLNLVVGFAGHLAIGYVALLTLGAYTTSVLVAGNVMPPLPVFAALPIAACVGAVFGVIVGLPALRLRTFYFAMSTLGFATIVTQIALAWQSVTGGGIGIAGPEFPAPFNTAWGFYFLCMAIAAFTTWISANIARSRFGRALIALRDAEVAAEATGISKPNMLIAIFLLAGALAAVAGGLFASLQTYITPDAFTFDLSILFFIAILIGGRGSILGPMLGTIILTILPEIAAPLAAWSTFLYAVLLLAMTFVGIKSYEYHDKFVHYEITLKDGKFADGHMVENKLKREGTNYTGYVVISGHEVADKKELYDLHSHKARPHHELKIDGAQILKMDNYGPWHNTYTAIYFTLTGLHALHVIGGAIVITYLWFTAGRMWKTGREQFTNRIEVSGLFWHFVDLVWIFLFPVLYLL